MGENLPILFFFFFKAKYNILGILKNISFNKNLQSIVLGTLQTLTNLILITTI